MDSNDKLNVGAWDLSSFKNQSGTEYNYSNGSTDYNEFSSIKGVLDMSHNKSPQASRLQHNNFTSAASGKPSSSRPPKLPNPSLPQFSNAFSSEQHHHPLHYSQKSQNLSFNNNSKNNENASHLKNSSVIKDPFSKYAVSEPSGILPPRASSLNQGFHLDNLLNQASTRPSNLSISPSSQQSSNHRTNNSRPSSISNHQSLHQQNSSQQQQQNSSQQHQQKLSHQQQQNSSQQQNKHNSFHQPQNDSSHQASIPYARSDAAIDSNLFNSKLNNSNNNNNSGDITLKSADEVFEVYSISDEDEVEEGVANIAASNCHTNKHKSNHCNNNSSNSTDSNKHNNADKKEERSFGMLSENKAFDDCDSSLCPINGTGHLDHMSHDVNFNSHNDVEEDVKEMKSRDEGEEVIEVDMGYINGYRVNKMDDNYDMSNRGDGEGVEVDDGGVEESGGGGDGLKESVVVMEDILIMNEDIIIDHAKAKKSNKTKKVHSSKVNNSNNNIDAGAEDNDNNRESVVKNGVEEEGEKVEELRTRSTRKRRRKVFMGERGDDDDDDLDDGDDNDDDQMVKVKRMSMMMHADEGGRSGEKGKEKGVSKGSRRGRGRGTKRGTTRNTQGRFDNDPDKSHDWKKQSYKEDVSSRRTRGNNDNDEDDEDDDGTKKMKKKKTLTISECINNSSGASGSRLQMVEYQWPEGQEWWVLEEPVTQLLGFKLRSRYSNISRRVISNPDELSFLSHHGCIDPLDDDVANNNNNNKNNNNSNNNSSNNKNNNSTKNSCDKARGEVAQSVSSGSLKKEEAAKALKKNKSKYTSVLSMEEVVDVLSKHYPAKYQEYTRGSRKQLKGVVKASSTASTATATATTSSATASIAATTTTTTSTTSNSSRYENLLRKSIKSAASFNSMLSKERLTERQSYFDLQTFEIHQASRRQPRGAVFSNRLLCESYPVALVPGQFQEGFKHYSPVELNYFPLNTALFAPPKHFDTFTSPEEPIVNLCADEHDNDLEEEEEEEDPLAATTAASGSTSSTKVEVKGMGGVVAGGSVAASHSFSGEDSTTSVLSVKKVRRGGPGRGKKHPMSVTARCSMCGQGWLNKYQEQDQLVRCCSCHFFNHTACLGLHPDMVDIIRTYKWQCMECKVCSKCAEPHDEDKMVFCDRCDRGYHTYCEGLSSIPEGRWECRLCTTNPPLPPTTSSNPPITPAKPKRGRPYKYPRNEHNVIITPVLNKHSSTAHNNNFNKNYNITNTPTNIYSKTLPTNHSFTPANKNNTNFNNNNKFSNNINISNIKNSNNNNNNTATSKFVMKEEEEEEEEEENEDDMSLALTCENDTLDSNNDDSDAKRGRIEDFKSNYVTYNNNNKNKNNSNNGSTSNKNSNNNGSSNDRTMDVGVNHKNTTFITNQNTNIANTITAITATTSITTTTNTTINISNIKNNSNINTNNKHQ